MYSTKVNRYTERATTTVQQNILCKVDGKGERRGESRMERSSGRENAERKGEVEERKQIGKGKRKRESRKERGSRREKAKRKGEAGEKAESKGEVEERKQKGKDQNKQKDN